MRRNTVQTQGTMRDRHFGAAEAVGALALAFLAALALPTSGIAFGAAEAAALAFLAAASIALKSIEKDLKLQTNKNQMNAGAMLRVEETPTIVQEQWETLIVQHAFVFVTKATASITRLLKRQICM